MRGAWAPGLAAGMRPLLTWKSTAAAPEPTSVGPVEVPSALRPWRLEQCAWNRLLPCATSSTLPDASAASAGLLAWTSTAYAIPTSAKANTRTAYLARGCRRQAVVLVTEIPFLNE